MMDLLNARSMVKKTSLQVRDNNHQSAYLDVPCGYSDTGDDSEAVHTYIFYLP